MTRRDYKCPECKILYETRATIGEEIYSLLCPKCGTLMERYFGNTRDIAINYGYRESRYYNDADARIAQYQFTNL